MKKDINFILVALFAALLMSMVVMAVYYQSTYQGLNAKHQEALRDVENTARELNKSIAEINEKTQKLSERERIMIDIINELNLSKLRVTSMSDYYSSLKGEKEQLETNLDDARTEKEKWRTDYTSTKMEFDLCTKDLSAKSQQIEDLNVEIIPLRELSTNIQNDVGMADTKFDVLDTEAKGMSDDIKYLNRKIGNIDDSCINKTLEDDLDDGIGELDDDLDSIRDEINILQEIINRIRARID